jgi:vesicle coat complex subunit
MARDNINDKNRIRRGFYSIKNQCHMLPDSYLEELFFLSFEFDDAIVEYCSHPVSTPFKDEYKKTRTYKPDSATKLKCGGYNFYEVKPYEYTQSNTFKLRMNLLDRHFQERFEAPLKVVTEKDLNLIQLENWELLYTFKRKPLNEYALELLKQVNDEAITFAELCGINSSLHLSSHIPFLILAHQRLIFDYSKKLEPSTQLRVA